MYLWIKVIHLASIISWMAGILYLYRILVNLKDQQNNHQAVHQVLVAMAQRLFRYITVPAMVASYLTGIVMLTLNPSLLGYSFMHIKIASIFILTWISYYPHRLIQRAASSPEQLPASSRLRFYNEIPTVLMLIILTMIIVRP